MGRAGRARSKKLTNILLGTLWRSGGSYPAWGTSPEWDEVLEDKQLLEDCERFHCLPSQLEEEDYHLLQRLRMIVDAEAQYQSQDRKARARRAKRRR